MEKIPGERVKKGTQEITRWGFQAADMARFAELAARVLVKNEDPERVRPDVTALRHHFQEIHYIRKGAA